MSITSTQQPPVATGRRRDRARVVRAVAAAVIGLAMALPLFWMLLVAFSPLADLHTSQLRWWPSAPTLDNFRRVFRLPV
ncbi:carbohydrate ABC transporter permease, partial [Streptomyces sp. SID11233]|nr:carbohydrate ABC transporter permease [Streptomyces sp. SID11233]